MLLSHKGVELLPTQVARQMTLPSYLACVQITSSVLGILAVLWATPTLPTLRLSIFPDLRLGARDKALLKKSATAALLLAPLVYLLAYGAGMLLAYDTLINELLTRGSQAVQRSTGELGRSAQQNSLLSIVPFTVVLAPLGEELVFRGGIYGGIRCLLSRTSQALKEGSSNPDNLEQIIPGLPPPRARTNRMRKVLTAHRPELIALLVSSFAFGAMHADMSGGMGIVRLTSASVLGVACGLARYWSGTLFAPLLLHAAYNFLGLATLRGWLVSAAWPTKYTIPTLLIPVGAGCLALYVLSVFLQRNSEPVSQR